jgi:hypothetical protein
MMMTLCEAMPSLVMGRVTVRRRRRHLLLPLLLMTMMTMMTQQRQQRRQKTWCECVVTTTACWPEGRPPSCPRRCRRDRASDSCCLLYAAYCMLHFTSIIDCDAD